LNPVTSSFRDFVHVASLAIGGGPQRIVRRANRAMSSATCSFCRHVNPFESTYCNNCGGMLGLKPCTGCDAVNAADAHRCHECGRAFTVSGLALEAPASANAIAAAHAYENRSSVPVAVRAIEPRTRTDRQFSAQSASSPASRFEAMLLHWRSTASHYVRRLAEHTVDDHSFGSGHSTKHQLPVTPSPAHGARGKFARRWVVGGMLVVASGALVLLGYWETVYRATTMASASFPRWQGHISVQAPDSLPAVAMRTELAVPSSDASAAGVDLPAPFDVDDTAGNKTTALPVESTDATEDPRPAPPLDGSRAALSVPRAAVHARTKPGPQAKNTHDARRMSDGRVATLRAAPPVSPASECNEPVAALGLCAR